MKLRILAPSAILAAATVLSAVPALGAIPTVPATRALQYLAGQQLADGSVDDSLGETADYALAAKYHGIDPNTLTASSNKSVYDYLITWLTGSATCAAASNNSRDGNNIGKLVQAVTAGAHDPTNFGGRNLLADLEGPGGTTGGVYNSLTGTFADCATGGQNAVYAQASAILGLEAAKNPAYPVPPAAIQRLRAMQDLTGGWATFGSTNSNATALALMALAPLQSICGAPADPLLTAALAYLHTQQDPASGGFTYSTAFGTASDPDSDALVIQALVSVLQDPSAQSWENSKGSGVTDILTFQDATTGGFKFDHRSITPVTPFATSEVPAGVDQAPFPDGSAHPRVVACPVPALAASSAPPTLPRAGAPAPRDAPWLQITAALMIVAGVALAVGDGRDKRRG